MNTKKIKEIIKFDVGKSIQNKWFMILNIVIFISILFTTNWSHIEKFLDEHNMNFTEMEDVTIQVLDNENILYDELEKQTSEIEAIKLEKVTENKYSKENIPDDDIILVEAVKDETELIKVKIISKEGISEESYDVIYNSVKESRNALFTGKYNITVEQLEVLSTEPAIERVFLGVDAENSETKELIKMVSVVLVYFVLILVTSTIANTIAQEKTSKSIEYVLTSVSAKEYLLAKVLGVTLTILTQVLYTGIYYVIGNLINSILLMNSGMVQGVATNSVNIASTVDMDIITYVLVMVAYLIFTVFLVGLVQATLSSKTNSVSEAGNTTTLILFVVIFLYFISLGAINPYTNVSPFMYVISCLPIVSTFFVPAMMIIGQSTTLQIVISFVLLIASVPLVFNICAKHFKNGILDYTTKKKTKKLFGKKEEKELTLKEKQEHELKIKFAKKFSFAIGMALILFVFLQTVLEMIFSMILPTVLKGVFDDNTILIITTGLVSTLSMIISMWFIKAYDPQEKGKSNITGKSAFNYIGVGIALMGLCQLVLPFIYKLFGIDYNILESFEVLPGEGFVSGLIFFIVLAVLPAIFEELFCRKAILNSAKRYGNAFAVVFSALVFAIIHMNFGQAIFAFIIGLIFGVIAVKTNSIKITVLLHFLNNAYAALLSIFEGNQIALGIINNIVIALLIFSFIILVKNVQNIFKIKKEDLKFNPDCKYIFRDYTFILAVILLIVMFAATENILKLL